MTTLTDLLNAVDNLDDPTPWWNQKSAIYGLIITCLIFTTLCVGLRLYVRYLVTRTPGWDDYLIIVTFITAWVANIGGCLLADAGLGKHFILLGLVGMSKFTETFWWCNACYNMTLALVKLSLLFQYRRLLDENPSSSQKRLRITISILIIIVSLWGAVWSFLAWFPASPISADWDFDNTTATRWGYGSMEVDAFVATFISHAATNMVLDIVVISLPILFKALWSTAGVQQQSRAAMMGLFCLGGLSVMCSIIRFAYIVKYKATTSPTFDPTWYGSSSTVLSVVEVDLATIVASLPVFWPHFRRNIASIMVTHEVEIKVTRKSEFRSRVGSQDTIRAAAWNGTVSTGEDNFKSPSQGVVLEELNISRRDTREYNHVPFDGRESQCHSSLSTRHFGIMSRESKEVLLK